MDKTNTLRHANRSEVYFTVKGDSVNVTSTYYCAKRGPRIASQLTLSIEAAREAWKRLVTEGFKRV